MHRTIGLFLHAECMHEQRTRVIEAVLVDQRPGEQRLARCRLGMIVAVPGANDAECLPVVTFRVGVVASIELGGTEVDERIGHQRMSWPVDRPISGQQLLVQRIGLVVMPGIEVRVGELRRVGGDVSGRSACVDAQADALLQGGDGAGVITLCLEHRAERGHGLRHDERTGRMRLPGECEPLTHQRFCAVELGLLQPQEAQIHEARGDGGGAVAVEPPAGQRLVQHRIGALQVAQLLEHAAERGVEFGLRHGFSRQSAGRLHATIEQGHDAQAFRRPRHRLAPLEQVHHELLDTLGACRVSQRGVPGARQPDRVETDNTHRRGEQQRRCHNAAPMPPRKLSQPVFQGVGAGLERLAGEEVVHVAEQGIHVPVAALRFLVHRGEAEHVEIGPGGSAFRFSGVAPGGRHRRAHRLLLEDDGLDLTR